MTRRIVVLFALLTTWMGGCIAERLDGPEPSASLATQTGFLLRTVRLSNGADRKFSVYIPPSYDPRKPTPTIMFLQGLGEGGTDGRKQTTVGLGPYIRRHVDTFNLIAVFPQSGGKWTTDDADAIAIACLDDVEKRYNVDRSRVYLTGVSMGGFGVWRTGGRHIERFAALVPMSAFDGSDYADLLTKTPIWAFHNTFDPLVFSSYTRSTVDKINELGGNAKITVYGTIGHNCWDRAYGEKDFWPWLLKQSKPQKPVRSGQPMFRSVQPPATPRGFAK